MTALDRRFRPIDHLINDRKNKDPRLYQALKDTSNFLTATTLRLVVPDATIDPKVYMLPETPNGDVVVIKTGLIQSDTPPLGTYSREGRKLSFRTALSEFDWIKVLYLAG